MMVFCYILRPISYDTSCRSRSAAAIVLFADVELVARRYAFKRVEMGESALGILVYIRTIITVYLVGGLLYTCLDDKSSFLQMYVSNLGVIVSGQESDVGQAFVVYLVGHDTSVVSYSCHGGETLQCV